MLPPWLLLIAFQTLLATYIWHLYIIATKWCESLSPIYVINVSWLKQDLPCPKAGGGQSHCVVVAAAVFFFTWPIQHTRKVQAGLRVKHIYWKPETVITTCPCDCFTRALFPCWFGVDCCLCAFLHFASGDHDVTGQLRHFFSFSACIFFKLEEADQEEGEECV